MHTRNRRLLAALAAAVCLSAAPVSSVGGPSSGVALPTSTAGGTFAAAPLLPPPGNVVGRARRLRSPSPCDVPPFVQGGPGVPYFVVEGTPRAGQPFRVQWSTKPTSPSDMPAWPAMLFVSFEAVDPVPLDALGAPGCHLQVLPEFIMLPSAGSILTQQGGRVNLDWTPSASVVGQDFYSQLLVFEPGVNGAGFLLSPALHVTIGN